MNFPLQICIASEIKPKQYLNDAVNKNGSSAKDTSGL
jgi:hypothetical protein